MKVYEGSDIRNVALIGHGHSGKTTLTAGFLYTAGATNRLTRVDEGTTITDFDDEEIQRKITISTALAFAEWAKKKINLIDTPGFNIFINDTKAGLRAADARWCWWTAWPASKCKPKRSGASPTSSSCRAPS